MAETKKKIYCFQAGGSHGDVFGYSVCEDGHVLGSHMSSSVGWLQHDLVEFKKEAFDKHCGPGNWETEWVDDPETHAGVQEASRLNKLLKPEETKE